MRDMFSQYELDKKATEEGVWLDYTSFQVRVTHAGSSNKKYVASLEKKMKPLRHALKANLVPEEKQRALLIETYAESIINGWKVAAEDGGWLENQMHKRGGGTVPFTPENVKEALLALPNLFLNIKEGAEEQELFLAVVLEEDAKN